MPENTENFVVHHQVQNIVLKCLGLVLIHNTNNDNSKKLKDLDVILLPKYNKLRSLTIMTL